MEPATVPRESVDAPRALAPSGRVQDEAPGDLPPLVDEAADGLHGDAVASSDVPGNEMMSPGGDSDTDMGMGLVEAETPLGKIIPGR